MRFLTSALFCVLVCPITAAFANVEDANSPAAYYYNTNTVCGERRWCASDPGDGCCVNPQDKPSATKTGYTLRGWTPSKLNDVITDTTAFSSKTYISKNGELVGSIPENQGFYPAWAKDCVYSDHCELTIGNDGSVTYTANCTGGTNQVGTGANISCGGEQTQINITFDYSNCGGGTCNHTETCNNGEEYTLPNPQSECIGSGYTFSQWNIVEGTRRTTQNAGEPVTCGDNLSNIQAICKKAQTGSKSINLEPFDMRP